MMRAGAILVVGATLLSVGGGFGAMTPEDVLVGNNSQIAFIDADDNGNQSADDCYFSAQMAPDGSFLMINGSQNEGPNKLRACEGPCYGNAYSSVDYAEVAIGSCTFSGNVPVVASFCEGSSCTSSNSTAIEGGAGRAAGAAPLTLRSAGIFGFGGVLLGSGQVCAAGGPAAQVTDESGATMLKDLAPFPTAQDPTHMCVADLPLELESGGFVMRTGCFPVVNGTAALALSGSPSAPLAQIDFDNLAPCAGRGSRAPTASEWGLIGLALSLLAGGTWLLSRRQRFADALPL